MTLEQFSARHNCRGIINKNMGDCIYADIMETIDLGIIVLGIKNQEIIFKNKFATEIFQDDDDTLGYKALLTLLLPGIDKDPLSEFFSKTYTLWYKDRLLSYSAHKISDRFIWIIIRDITEKRRLESIAEAVNAIENISYVFSGIRHELGNPINSIKMTLSVLKKNINEYSTNAVEKFVDRAMTEISRVEYLLQALKSFSIFEGPNIQNVKLAEFLVRFISLVQGDLRESGIKISKAVDPSIETISADPRLLHQVMLNLITNASDAMENIDNPEIIIRVKANKKDFIAITVEDNGCGMSEEMQTNLFKPFYTTKPRGTGLGLMITLKMVTLMNGNMEIKSIKDVGTKVTVLIPGGAANAKP
jgi:signal transduction histidine kinase